MSAPRAKTAKAKAKAKAAPKGKGRVVAEWEERCRPFVEATRERFDFLAREHGFGPAQALVTPPECLVRYAKPGGGVDILTDRLGPPWVVVTGGEPPVRVGLHEIVAELDPGYKEREPTAPDLPSREEMQALLEHHAAFLREHAREVLGGIRGSSRGSSLDADLLS